MRKRCSVRAKEESESYVIGTDGHLVVVRLVYTDPFGEEDRTRDRSI